MVGTPCSYRHDGPTGGVVRPSRTGGVVRAVLVPKQAARRLGIAVSHNAVGRAPRPACNARSRGSRRASSRAGPSDPDDPEPVAARPRPYWQTEGARS